MPAAQRPAYFVYRERVGYRLLRRIMDVAVALLALLLLAPVLAAAIAAIALDDGAPVLFRQRRVGRFERTFTIYKLRTMRRESCGDAYTARAGGDARVTRVGRWLRKLSIDEIPQLFNVLRGEMSLVGPRPEMPFIVARYQPWQHVRHLARPGITCIWQTRCRSTIPLERPEATALDLEYMRRASLLTDGVLLAQTLSAVLTARGAY
ncbi:sugar transferase [bacterium]|nr:MAG: sugar transferase [bacterium]